MKVYSVAFNMRENCTSCIEVNQVATYVVFANAEHTFFDIKVEADNSKDALIVAAQYVKKFIVDEACNLANKVANIAMEDY